jgi:hypothetical protein
MVMPWQLEMEFCCKRLTRRRSQSYLLVSSRSGRAPKSRICYAISRRAYRQTLCHASWHVTTMSGSMLSRHLRARRPPRLPKECR